MKTISAVPGFLVLTLCCTAVRAACPVPGSGIDANGTTVSENGCTITTSTTNTPGVLGQNSADVTLSNSTIATTAAGSEGVRASNSLVNLNNVAITTSGNSNGLFVSQGAHIIMNGGSVGVGGVSAFGLQVVGTGSLVDLIGTSIIVTANSAANGTGLLANNISGAGTVNISNGTVSVSGASATGAFASGAGSTVVIDNTSFTVNGMASGFGVRANNGGSMTVRNGSAISTTGSVYGFQVDTASTGTISASSIQTTGNFAFGIYAQGASTVQATNTSVITGGTNSYGVIINGNVPGTATTVTGDGLSLQTSGTNATGAFLVNNAAFTISNGSIATQGVNAPAVQISVTGADVTSFTASNTQISAANAAAFHIDQGTANLTLNNVLAGSGLSQLLVVGASGTGTATITATGSALTGTSQIMNGATADLTLAGGSTWNLTGDSALTSLANNASSINFTPGAFKTLTVNNFAGNGGTIRLNTMLGGDGSPSDKLVIDGGAATGSTGLVIVNAGGAGAKTTADGILVVDAINGATTTGAFRLAAPAAVGAYDYQLFQGGLTGASEQSWFLRSTEVVRPETSTYAVMPAAAANYGAHLMNTLDERWGSWRGGSNGRASAGNIRVASAGSVSGLGSAAPAAFPDGAWGRVLYQHGKRDGASAGAAGNGPSYDYDFQALQGGLDLWQRSSADGSHIHAGAYAAYGVSKSDITHFDGRSAGSSEFTALTGGGYLTFIDREGWYVDTVVQLTHYDARANANRGLADLKSKGYGLAASLESGYPFRMSGGWTVEPQAQLTISRLKMDEAQDVGGAVSFDDVDSHVVRLGARIARRWNGDHGPVTAWTRVSVLNQGGDDAQVRFAGPGPTTPFTSALGGSWTELKFGINANISKRTALFAAIGYQQSFDGDTSAYDARFGLRVEW